MLFSINSTMKMLLLLLQLIAMSNVTFGKIVDLSHVIGPDTYTHYNTYTKYNRTTIFFGEFVPGIYADTGRLLYSEHMGTHIDAPSHVTAQKQSGERTLDEIPIEESVADGVMLDFSAEASKDRYFAVTKDMILAWEEEHGQIPENAAVLVNFGWHKKFSDPTDYLSTSDYANSSTYKFPFISREAGIWLYQKRKLLYIGTDTLTPDPYYLPDGTGSGFPMHIELLKNNRYIVENMNGLDQLPPRGFRFYCAPVKFVGSSGAPVRAFAITGDGSDGNSASTLVNFRESYYGFCILVLALFTAFLGRPQYN